MGIKSRTHNSAAKIARRIWLMDDVAGWRRDGETGKSEVGSTRCGVNRCAQGDPGDAGGEMERGRGDCFAGSGEGAERGAEAGNSEGVWVVRRASGGPRD